MENLDISSDVPLSSKTITSPILKGEYLPANKESYPKIFEKFSNVRDIDEKWLQITEHNVISPFSKENVLKYTDSFVKENFKDKKYHLKSFFQGDSSFSIVYEEVLNDFFLENSYIQFIINSQGSIDISILSINTQTSSKQDVKVMSSAEAISSAISYLKGRKIHNISLVYKSNENENDIKNILAITLQPFYRLQLDKEEFYYVSAMKN